MSTVQAAQGAARKAVEATYSGTLTVTEMKKDMDTRSKLTKTGPVVVLEDQPCKLAFETLRPAVRTARHNPSVLID